MPITPCGIADPKARLVRLLTAMEAIVYIHTDLIDQVPNLRQVFERQVPLFRNLLD